ncbi:MFS transporter [Streptomyces sp. A1136]|uniref:MFS transporter n=1 Tax=Streptomyces sp. A1136 TaxID=2563102 RepID=UPI0014468E8B|nr:MFS transporter [Streptomyces sp. A1136]
MSRPTTSHETGTAVRGESPPGLVRVAVSAFFFVLGLGFGSWVVRIPDVQHELGISKGSLGAALLAVTVGSLVGMPLAGWLGTRMDGAWVLRVSGAVLAVSIALPPYATDWWTLALALIVVGVGNGALGVAMNVQGSLVERTLDRPVMSSFHGVFSIGGLVGSLGGGAVASAGIGPRAHLSATAAILLCLTLAAGSRLLSSPPDRDNAAPVLVRPTKTALIGGTVAFCVLFGEGAVSDWSAVYLKNDLSAAALAGMGYAAFAGAMAAGRLAGDRLAAAVGPRRLVIYGGCIGTVGITSVVLIGHPLATVVGFGLMGLGLSVVYPQVVSAAGATGGKDTAPDTAIAAVSTIGYFGFLIGPPAIGGLAQMTSLRWAFLLVALCSVLIIPLAGRALTATAPGRDASG